MTATIKTPSAEELPKLNQLIAQCFNVPLKDWQPTSGLLGPENSRIAQVGQQVVGGLKIYSMGQWFGGQRLPMAGLAAVAIAPEHRGTGIAADLLTQTLRDLHTQQVPLSTLYAATQKLYRKVGYEQAGIRCQFSLPIKSLLPGDRTLEAIAVDPTDWQQFQGMYQQQAIAGNGNLDRHPILWQRLVEDQNRDLYAYRLGPEANPEGYLIFHQESTRDGYHIRVRDQVMLTPAAVRRLWTLVADHRSIGQQVYWHGPVIDPLLTQVNEQTYQVEDLTRWFMRIVDVPQALKLRGYPLGVETELHLEIRDRVILENQGRFVLQVAQGKGEVTPGGRGDMKLSVQGLAPLYSGLLSPQQLQVAGLLESDKVSSAIAALLFRGAEPWMPDHF